MGIRNEHKGRLMTIEEAIQALKKEKRTALHENKVAFDMAIKALEEESILDKIRTEIIEKFGDCECDEERGFLYELLEVIDKYKGESEVEDGKNDRE